MHPINPMSGHILPVIFFFHFGEQLNDVGHAGKGGLDPDDFWHAWARGAEMTVDLFDPKWSVWDWVEHDRSAAPPVERDAAGGTGVKSSVEESVRSLATLGMTAVLGSAHCANHPKFVSRA